MRPESAQIARLRKMAERAAGRCLATAAEVESEMELPDIALADKIASLRYLRVTGPKRNRAHYEATAATAGATRRPRFTSELADLLDALAERDGSGA